MKAHIPTSRNLSREICLTWPLCPIHIFHLFFLIIINIFLFSRYHANPGDLCQQHHITLQHYYFVLCSVWISTIILYAESDIYSRNYFLDLGGHLMHGLPDFEYLEGRDHVIFIFVVLVVDINYELNKCLVYK